MEKPQRRREPRDGENLETEKTRDGENQRRRKPRNGENLEMEEPRDGETQRRRKPRDGENQNKMRHLQITTVVIPKPTA